MGLLLGRQLRFFEIQMPGDREKVMCWVLLVNGLGRLLGFCPFPQAQAHSDPTRETRKDAVLEFMTKLEGSPTANLLLGHWGQPSVFSRVCELPSPRT